VADETPTDELSPPEIGHVSRSTLDMLRLVTTTRAAEITVAPAEGETPTLRVERGNGPKDEGWSRAYLYLGDSADAEVDIELPDAVFAALAAALDPRTTEVLFEQRDTAIAERDRLRKLVDELTEERNEALDGWTQTRLEALTAQVDITRLGDADRHLRCNACGHVRTEPREGR
jgi:hypothetical protein